MKTEETIEDIEAWCRHERRKSIDYCKQRLLKAIDDLGDEAMIKAIAELYPENWVIRCAAITATRGQE